ncbi:hypothetical protein Ciccas_002921 [Cichlidogyrus casuarinus]|uniref:Uncharacterized protein n=1 Tax=Cichlidogyrus casuarinus TaxID=1844966 RepID=A0ABD2QFU9_9PLAT
MADFDKMKDEYSSLRKQLDILGYRMSFHFESLPLVTRLTNDLICTTDSLRKSKQEISSLEQYKCKIEKCVQPYKDDNARLLKENNSLHAQVLKLREGFELDVNEKKSQILKLENELNDGKFVMKKYLERISHYEDSLTKLTKELMVLDEDRDAIVSFTSTFQLLEIAHSQKKKAN